MTTSRNLLQTAAGPPQPCGFFTSAGLILAFSLMTIFSPTSPGSGSPARWWVSTTFGWYYLLAATLYIVFVVFIAASRFGSD